MVRLVHIAPEPEASTIRRNGLHPRRTRHWIEGYDRFVWAFPVLQSYTQTYQWARELKRFGTTTQVAVTFKIPDGEQVFVRHFTGPPAATTAAAAAGTIRALADSRGYEIVIPRRIAAAEIVSVRVLPRAIGWRYAPTAKNQAMRTCDCPVCMPVGEVKAARYRARVKAEMARRGIVSVDAPIDPDDDRVLAPDDT